MQNIAAVDSTGSDLLGVARASERTRCAAGLLAWPEEPTSIGNQKRVKVCSRCNLAVHQGLDEGRVAMPFADPHHCGVNDLRPGTPRLRASWIEARATKAPRVAASFSK